MRKDLQIWPIYHHFKCFKMSSWGAVSEQSQDDWDHWGQKVNGFMMKREVSIAEMKFMWHAKIPLCFACPPVMELMGNKTTEHYKKAKCFILKQRPAWPLSDTIRCTWRSCEDERKDSKLGVIVFHCLFAMHGWMDSKQCIKALKCHNYSRCSVLHSWCRLPLQEAS